MIVITDNLVMNCSVGQKVYIRSKTRGFRLSSSVGEIVSIDEDQELVMVRFPDDQSSYFSKDQLISFNELPIITVFLLALTFIVLFSFIFIYPFRLYVK